MRRPEPGTVEADQLAYARAVHHGYDGLAQWLAARLDGPLDVEHARLSAPGALGAAAVWYARSGLPVLPLTPNGKTPLGGSCCAGTHARGCRDALANERAARYWWAAHPQANVGLATGWSVDVIDVDGPGGWRSWLDGIDWPPVIGTVSTPRPGGVHRYGRVTGYRNGARIGPGIDFRGRGGYVVAPPSCIDGRRYAWVQPLTVPTR
jgi:Bifunctional DNA primase/polymerase, N-terminal